MWNKATKFLHLSRAERLLLVEAFYALGRARLALVLSPFRRVAASMGDVGGESPVSAPPGHDEIARQVGWAVETAARHTPWSSRCLAQALAAWRMLGRRGIAGTVYFGVAKNPDRSFGAHAWLRCGTRFVTGEEPGEQYRVLASFAPGISKVGAGIIERQGK